MPENMSEKMKAFQEIERVLTPDGLLLISVRGNDQYPFGKTEKQEVPDEAQEIEKGKGIKVYCFPAATYIKIAQRHDLKLLQGKEIVRYFYAILRKRDLKEGSANT